MSAPAAGSGPAFTLVELLGVLAIIAILGALLAPVVVRRVDLAAVKAEAANLNTLSNALVLQALRSNAIPSEAVWFQAAGNWLSYAPATITTNARRYARAYLVDTNGWGGTTGYVQTVSGTIITNSARVLIVSSLSARLPVATGRPGTSAFNELWNVAPNTVPASWASTNWRGRGEDLLIQRVNWQPLFSRLVLANRDTNAATYTVAGRTNFITSYSISNAYYFNGTVVSLGATNRILGLPSTNSQATFVLNQNSGYVFERGYWRAQIDIGPDLPFQFTLPGDPFNDAAKAFVTYPNPYDGRSSGNNPNKGGDQQQVLSAMVNFMLIYELWANNPHGPFTTYGIGTTGGGHDSIYWGYLQDAASVLDQTSGQGKDTHGLSGLLY